MIIFIADNWKIINVGFSKVITYNLKYKFPRATRTAVRRMSTVIKFIKQILVIHILEVTPREKKYDFFFFVRTHIKKNRDTDMKTFLNFLRSIFIACLDISPDETTCGSYHSLPFSVLFSIYLTSKILRGNIREMLSVVIGMHKSINFCNHI